MVVNKFSKYTLFMGIHYPYTASSVARVFLDNVYRLHGLPATIISDRDVVFISLFQKELFSRQGVKLCYSIAYHLQSNDQTEVVNKCLENYLHCMAGTFPTQWVKWLSFVEWWYNINYHTATKSTLYEIIYDYPPLLHISYFPRDSQLKAMDDFFLSKRELMLQTIKRTIGCMTQNNSISKQAYE